MAPKIPEGTIREIAERASIFDVISRHVDLSKAGKNYKGLCPFHPDKNPSFFVNPERNTFHCFGCQTGGDVYAFLMKFHDIPFLQAVQELARQTGISVEPIAVQRDPRKEEAYQKAIQLNLSVSKFFHMNLMENPKAEMARKYLADRGLNKDTISTFSLGYAPNSWDGLVQFLSRQQVSTQLAASLGLLLPRKSGQGHYDRFRHRVMFPILGTTSQVLGFGGRCLDADGPKYINSPESPLYKKGAVLYGLHCAQESIRRQDAVILVEGYLDLITLHQHGFTNSVAVLGTALTLQQIDILKRYTRNFFLIFDGDEAGKKASFRNLGDLLERNVRGQAVYLPQGEDPDSYLRKQGGESFLKRLQEAAPLLDLFIEDRTVALSEVDPVETKVATLRQLLPVITKIPDRLEQSIRVKTLSEKFGIAESSLRAEIAKPVGAPRPGSLPSSEDASGRQNSWPVEERLACQILIQFPHLIPKFMESQVLDSFDSPALREVILNLERLYRQSGTLQLPDVLKALDDPVLTEFLTGLSCREEFEEQEAETALQDTIRRVERKQLRGRLSLLNRKIQEAEEHCQKDLWNRLCEEKQRLQQKNALL